MLKARDLATRALPAILFSVCLAVLCTMGLVSGAIAQNYLPLTIGNIWHYESLAGYSEDRVVTGTNTIRGTTTYVIDYQNSTSNTGLENYWTTGSEGDVLLWGWWLEFDGFGILWDPAILYLDAPLFLGKTWNVTTTGYELPDTTFFASFDITFQVVGEGMISVPAGDFFSFAITYTVSAAAPGGDARALYGARIAAAFSGGPTDWYSDGIGQVQYDTDDLYQLVSFNVPTATQPTTWGGIKGLYR